MTSPIFDGLNDEQASAVERVRGPVCILAGAGSGKTTTITRRIAFQVASGAFAAGEILAVTFTDKAAREMRSRLAALGADAVRARTFHAEALAQYRRFSSDTSDIVPSKAAILGPLVSRLRAPYRFTAVRDVATEVEWAKNRRIPVERYRAELGDREPPIPADLMAGVYASYERAKERRGLMDFEDLIARTVDMLRRDRRALAIVQARYRAFTVDEYQDVNSLQQDLLDVWVGERDDVCVVGDDYQAIFSFTGASPHHLLGFPGRFDDCHVVRLVANYRSTPQVLELANRLTPRLGGSSKILRPVLPDGPPPEFREHATGELEARWIVKMARALHDDEGVPWEEIAVLYRINGRSEDLEEQLASGAIPYQVRDGAFLRRPAARAVLARLRRADGPVGATVEQVVRDLGYREDADADGDEATRLADLARLLRLAEEYPGDDGVAGFVADLARRFAGEEDGRGVQILTYHRAKGLEFDAVFLPRLEDKELPFALSTTAEDLAEERRLFYVGITRAKRRLFVSWARSREGERRKSPKPSPFLRELLPANAPGSRNGTQGGIAGSAARVRSGTGGGRSSGVPPIDRGAVDEHDVPLYLAFKEWRLQRARAEGVPAYVVFNDQTLARIASSRPRLETDLLSISGVGPAKVARYGEDVLSLVRAHGPA